MSPLSSVYSTPGGALGSPTSTITTKAHQRLVRGWLEQRMSLSGYNGRTVFIAQVRKEYNPFFKRGTAMMTALLDDVPR